jgi:hypothetical protein
MLKIAKNRMVRRFCTLVLLLSFTLTQVACGGINLAGIADAVAQTAPLVLTFNGKGTLSAEEFARLDADFKLFLADGERLKNAPDKQARIAAVKQLLDDFVAKAPDFRLQNVTAGKFFSEFYSKTDALLLGLSIYFNITGGTTTHMAGGARNTRVPQTKEEINAGVANLKKFVATAGVP